MWRLVALFGVLYAARAEILTPPYFNLALGKKITATATCGDEGNELFCKLVGANADHEEHVIQGQVCDICDATIDAKKHPAEFAVDGLDTWWQSPPLSRGMKYNEVNLTIDLGQEFHVAYVFVRMGNSPRPGLWALEKSSDYGKTFTPWQYFSDSAQDCERYFGKESLMPITRDDSVICSTEYSKIVPLEGGEIPISLLNSRPSANKYFNSSVLQEWTRATNVRLRLLRTKNLLGHLMSVARQDPTVTRRYYYSIKDISIGGRCMCNGHAESCDPAEPESDTSILVCRCQHNTCGSQCNECCPGFEQKKWRISQHWNRFACEPCNCHNHSTECSYDASVDEQRLSLDIHGRYEGGGVCQNCQHHTEGINCNKCQPTYFRPYGKRWDELDVCQPCNCDLHYSTGNCEEETGRCECRVEYNPPNCDSCAYGYFDYPNCKPCVCNLNGTEDKQCTPVEGLCRCKYNFAGNSCEMCADGYYSPKCENCECNMVGSVSPVCDKDSGNCTCKSKYSGRTCNQCQAGYFNYPACKQCNCDVSGTEPNVCDDVTGQCICKVGFGGPRCDQCLSGYYMEVRGRERTCVPCACSPTGASSTSCAADGKCNCLANFGGKQCAQCSPGYYRLPECLPCNCDVSGSIGSTCDENGFCHCKPNFDGPKCDRCKEQFYNYPACEECNCDPRGVVATFAGCGSVPAGELCQCKDRVQGRICNDCKPLFWNLQEYNPSGCEECNCHLAGTLGGLGACDTKSGQCVCKMHSGERQCDQCRDGFYKLESNNVFGCTECDCDVGGSIDNNCDKLTGQCRCHSRVEGRRCDRPIRAHYFPTLHQFQYELEEGTTPSGPVRYRSSEDVFPGYSWKGYVVFSLLQNEVINIVHISKSSLYRMVLRYSSPKEASVSIVITPESVVDTQQKFTVYLKPTSQPTLVTVAGDKGPAPAPFVMNPGNWTVTIKTTKEIMIDYFTLIPEAYYEATVLTKLVDKPCVVGDKNLCRHFAYPSLAGRARGDVTTLGQTVTSFIDDQEQLKELNARPSDIALLNNLQSELQYNMKIEPNGPYVLLVEYVTPLKKHVSENEVYSNETATALAPRGAITVRFQSGDGPESVAIVNLNECPYTAACRQVVVDDLAKIYTVNVVAPNNVIYLEAERDTMVGIKSIVAVPEAEWHLDYMTPRPFCLRRGGRCEPAVFSAAVDSKKVEAESGTGGSRETRPTILDNSTVVVYLTPDIELKLDAKVSTPGDYMVVLHYYQPDHPESTLSAVLNIDNSTIEDATTSIEHCPSNSGCRALLRAPGGNTQFYVNDNVTLTFKVAPGKEVWLDYVLLIATPDFVDSALKEANLLDYTREFIEKCALNSYYISPNETGFCRDAMFSITAEYNSGALSCFCDYLGSMELECDTFGGQCPCRRDVIGRTCSACRTGYYGFPDCKPCNCPSTAICDDYGMCICPKNVEGENCDRCKPLTFNFDVQRGCDECRCSPLGVVNGELQCEQDSGNCRCKNNVIGRACDHCEPGHYAFPACEQCSCELAGSTGDVCDQATAQCYCKKHVAGQACDTCKEEYFNLQPDNVDGCTRCYCFGKTTRCTSSYLSWAQITGMSDWRLANIDANRTLSVFPLSERPAALNDSTISADTGTDGNQKVLYFHAPEQYLGKRLSSYGGYLTYIVYYTSRLGGNAIGAADVIIASGTTYLVHTSVEQPPALQDWEHSVRISEDEFTNVDGSPITREQFMNVIVNVTDIFIRATYWDEAISTMLMSVSLDIGVDQYTDDRRATSVEHCQCPKAYRGLSCEQCAEGHYRLSSGPHAGFCVPCQCNGHSDECDVNTGVCLNCQDNTYGDHCEQCIEGYHGDATVGTQVDCLICACPMPYPSNNFAIGCDLSDNGSLISCQCKPGYGGLRCEFCAAGYYGEPEMIGEYCKPCNCSGNIVEDDPGSCDSITGDCLKCVNNTAGSACNLCAPGFYGDAVFQKNCTACTCDEFGMDHCDPTTGRCVCRAGVLGDACDRCAADHWGLASGRGCEPCNCGLAATDTQCDLVTGQCKCAKGVTGRHCDQCAAGYWNYTKEGCDHCNCNTGYSVGFMCNATGQCECLPGVVGEKCDRCPERWVLIPHEGCLECDSCTDALIFSVEDLSYLLANETSDFKDKADSFFTTQRLNYISNQTQLLTSQLTQPGVSDGLSSGIGDVIKAVADVETTTKNLLRSAEFAATDSDKQITRAADLTSKADDVLSAVREHSAKAREVVRHVGELATGLELSQQPKVDGALMEATQIKNDIAAKSLEPKFQQAALTYSNATEQLERMSVFVQPVKEQAKSFEGLVNATRELKNKMDDMLEYIDLARHTAESASQLNANNRQSKVGNKVLSVGKLNGAAMKDLIDAALDINNATRYNVLASDTAVNASAVRELIDASNAALEDRLGLWAIEIPQLYNLTDEAMQHANDVKYRADNLRLLAERENNNTRTQDAYAAASAYSSIVAEIADAKAAADNATEALANVTAINNSLKDRVAPALARSRSLHDRATAALRTGTVELRPNLTRAEDALRVAWASLQAADDDDNAIQLSLPSPSASILSEEVAKADAVSASVRITRDVMAALGDGLARGKDWAQTLPKAADDALKMTSSVRTLLSDIKEMTPNITSKYNSVSLRQEDLENRRKESDERLGKLRDLIEQARNVANRLPVGVTFDRKSTLQPRLPESVDEMSTSTHVSAYFRTKEKNGFLLYLGNPEGTKLRRTKSDDFMVLAIANGYPYVTMDIGDGAESGREPARVASDKYVADDRWYQVVVDRVGRSVKLSIRESLDNGTEHVHSKDAILPGQHTIFNLDKDKSKLYVGGVPSDAKLQAVDFPAFEGQIEELMIGDTPVGLWNFERAAELKGARQRDKLVSSQSSVQEYRFNGRSHVTMPGVSYLSTDQNYILLFFKTYAPDGLIYLVGEGSYFFSLQMQDGKVYLQVSLGNAEELTILGTSKSYNDGKWHKLDAKRYQSNCSLTVDNETIRMVATSSIKENIPPDTMNFGGNNKGILQVTSQGFDGCMRQINIYGVTIDLTNSTESIGVGYGCQFASLVSLSGADSYLRFVNMTSENLQLTLKFRTREPEGLLFVYVSRTQTPNMAGSVSLSLVDGRLVLISQSERLDTGTATYNDSQWHVVTVIHSPAALQLVVDDFDHFSTDSAPAPLHILDGVLFIGGLQPGYVVSGGVGSKRPLRGCVADAALNGRVLNLLEPYNNGSVTFGRCGTTITTGGVAPDQTSWAVGPPSEHGDLLPTVPPLPPITQAPDLTTSKVALQSWDIPVTTPAPVAPATKPTRQPATSARPTAPPRPKPRPAPGCALADDPSYVVGDPDEGYRFGTRNDSRIEYGRLPGRQLDGFDLTMSLRTFDVHGGLIFFAAGEEEGHYLAVYMQEGKLHLSFSCGLDTGLASSAGTYNDAEWHSVSVARAGGSAKLAADGERVAEASATCSRAVLRPPYSYGGLRDAAPALARLQGFYQPFKGCLKGLQMNGQYVSDISERVNALRCTDSVEDGVYFPPASPKESNYLKLIENFKVGFEISVTIDVKPRNSTGLLLSVHGKRDFLVLEMLDNEVVANVENGRGPFHASYKLGNNFTLCDGKWHKIHVVKSHHVVSVGVNGHFSDPGLGISGSTDTRSALYVGGHERALAKVRGVRSKTGFTGCIRNISIRDKPIQIPLTAAGRKTQIGVCPKD